MAFFAVEGRRMFDPNNLKIHIGNNFEFHCESEDDIPNLPTAPAAPCTSVAYVPATGKTFELMPSGWIEAK
uniref:Uncharacterized protein n=1 Tax=uncultured bacterium contig00055 TaxID=1181539 RepID=A0A806K143_9BACT|nr:hypothetical protein [uncultured bacterium contig00055]